jgi:hypothetical protein
MARGATLPKPSKIRVVVGEPLIFTREECAVKGKEGYTQLSAKMMQAIAALELPPG